MAGKDIDQPWLSDPFVLDLRFSSQVPDRRGNLVTSSPLLTGMTDDGRYVTMRPDGTPAQLNTPVHIDEQTVEYTIRAGSEDALEEQIEKQRRKAEKQGKSFTPGEQKSASDRPEIRGSAVMSPCVWHREAAKIALGLLSEQQPAAWRQGQSAESLRQAMRASPAANQVQWFPLEGVRAFADAPASAAVASKTERAPAVECRSWESSP